MEPNLLPNFTRPPTEAEKRTDVIITIVLIVIVIAIALL